MAAPDLESLTHPLYGTPARWWRYDDGFAVAGFEDGTGCRVAVLPAARTGAGWDWRGLPGPAPLYGDALLDAHPDAPVLVVEGEATAEAARRLFPDHVCLTWPGGGDAVAAIDIAPLEGRTVTLWPANDATGLTAMARLKVRLAGHAGAVFQVTVPPSWPGGWDVADPPPPGVTAAHLRHRLRAASHIGVDPIASDDVAPPAPEPLPILASDPAIPPWPDGGDAAAAAPAGYPGAAGYDPLDWPAPDLSLLEERHGIRPVFPARLLPGFWRGWAERGARAAAAPVDYVALSLLTAAAGLIGTARRVAPVPSWSEPCILWSCLVGPSSFGKTPALETSLDLVRALEGMADAGRPGGRPDSVPAGGAPSPADDSGQAPRRRLVALDPSLPTLSALLHETARGVLLPRDEQDAWLHHLLCDPRKRGERAFWLASWSGKPWAAEVASGSRRRPEAVSLAGPAVSLLGTIQPDALGAALAGADEAMVARFLFAWPQRPPFHPLDPAETLAPAALAALARLRDLPPRRRDLPLADDALAAFDAFRQAHHEAAGRLEGREAGWWGKGPGTVLRLAGVLTFLDWASGPGPAAEPERVALGALRAAADLWQFYLWPHARALFRTDDGSSARHVGRVLRWLAAQRLLAVSREQIRREALAQAVNAHGADEIAAVLVAGGWLRPLEQQPRRPGRPPRRWQVSPRLWRDGLPPGRPTVRALPVPPPAARGAFTPAAGVSAIAAAGGRAAGADAAAAPAPAPAVLPEGRPDRRDSPAPGSPRAMPCDGRTIPAVSAIAARPAAGSAGTPVMTAAPEALGLNPAPQAATAVGRQPPPPSRAGVPRAAPGAAAASSGQHPAAAAPVPIRAPPRVDAPRGTGIDAAP